MEKTPAEELILKVLVEELNRYATIDYGQAVERTAKRLDLTPERVRQVKPTGGLAPND